MPEGLAVEHEHSHPALQHHFENMEQQREAGTLGMWVFLVTEIMFFGALFLAYTIYRYQYPAAFASALCNLLDNSDLLARMGQTASTFSLTRYDIGPLIDNHLRLYAELQSRAGRRGAPCPNRRCRRNRRRSRSCRTPPGTTPRVADT